MEIKDGNKVVIELEKKDLDVLNFVASTSDVSIEELFKRFLARSAMEAVRMYRNPHEEDVDREDEVVRTSRPLRYVQRWARQKNGINYFIIKSYLSCVEHTQSEKVDREQMLQYYMDQLHIPRFTEVYEREKYRFINNFRLMCSVGNTAYGPIFSFENGYVEVAFDEIKKAMFELKDEFLNN